MFFNVMFSFSKTTDELVMMKCCKIKLFSGSIWHGVSNEPGAYLEPSQTCERAFLQKQLTASAVYAKKFHRRCSACF